MNSYFSRQSIYIQNERLLWTPGYSRQIACHYPVTCKSTLWLVALFLVERRKVYTSRHFGRKKKLKRGKKSLTSARVKNKVGVKAWTDTQDNVRNLRVRRNFWDTRKRTGKFDTSPYQMAKCMLKPNGEVCIFARRGPSLKASSNDTTRRLGQLSANTEDCGCENGSFPGVHQWRDNFKPTIRFPTAKQGWFLECEKLEEALIWMSST
jgi:hypothetical protein